MSSQLDILALEPYFGGARKSMLDTVIRCSRHRWTLLKLPPRRMERRLAAAAQWFSEQLTRHWVGQVDVLFTSEAMNLSDLYRGVPQLARKPAVVYFHDNELPATTAKTDKALDLVNLNTAQSATELWFNSHYHLRTFLARATAMVERHHELSARNPLPEITGKAQIMSPPDELGIIRQMSALNVKRDARTIFVDTREADVPLLNEALMALRTRGEKYQLITVGPVDGLAPGLPRRTVGERDEDSQVVGLYQSAIHISTRRHAMADHHAVRALAVGCWPIYPKAGVYPELLPPVLHNHCLFDPAIPDSLAERVQDYWQLDRPDDYQGNLNEIVKKFDSIVACKAFDHRLEELAAQRGGGKS